MITADDTKTTIIFGSKIQKIFSDTFLFVLIFFFFELLTFSSRFLVKISRHLLTFNSVTRLGYFWKFLGAKFLAKVAQILSNNFWLLWKWHFYVNLMWILFGQVLDQIGLLFTPTSGLTAFESLFSAEIFWVEKNFSQKVSNLMFRTNFRKSLTQDHLVGQKLEDFGLWGGVAWGGGRIVAESLKLKQGAWQLTGDEGSYLHKC